MIVAPPNSTGANLLLAKASTPEQEATIGNQTAGRVFLFLNTDDFWHDYNEMVARGIEFVRAPKEEALGQLLESLDSVLPDERTTVVHTMRTFAYWCSKRRRSETVWRSRHRSRPRFPILLGRPNCDPSAGEYWARCATIDQPCAEL